MEYKGLTARHSYDVRTRSYIGEIINDFGVIAFSAGDLLSLREAMVEAVEEYLAQVISRAFSCSPSN